MADKNMGAISVKDWVNTHDDKWLFTGIYVSAAVILSMTISMFWLAAVVFLHGILEWFSLDNNTNTYSKIKQIIWHLKLDIVLVIFALWLALYMDAIFGLIGLNASVRAGAQIGSRFAIIEKIFRGFLLTLDDIAQIIKAVAKKKNTATIENGIEVSATGWTIPDKLTMAFGVMLSASIIFSPWMTDHNAHQVISILAQELHPWPS